MNSQYEKEMQETLKKMGKILESMEKQQKVVNQFINRLERWAEEDVEERTKDLAPHHKIVMFG